MLFLIHIIPFFLNLQIYIGKTMELIKNPDFYINCNKSQFKTPIEVLKKNFKNLQKLIEKNNLIINNEFKKIKLVNYTNKKEKIKRINKLIEIQLNFNKKLSFRINQHNEFVNRLIIRINRLELIDNLYNKYNNLNSNQLNKLPNDLKEFYQTENNLLIIDYLLRNHKLINNNNKELFLNNFKLNKLIDYDIIIQGIKIYDEIVINKNLKLLKQWCIENKKNLELIKIKYPNLITSDIEFECNFQDFLQKIEFGNYEDALIFARKCLTNNNRIFDKFEKVKNGSSLIWLNSIIDLKPGKNESGINNNDDDNMNNENKIDLINYYSSGISNNNSKMANSYLKLFEELSSPKTWDRLGDYFLLNFRLIYGMNQIPQLNIMLNIGGSVLKTKQCEFNPNFKTNGFKDFINKQVNHNSNNKEKNYLINTECPICSIELNNIVHPLPYSLQTKSNLFDDPVMLLNNNIYSFKDLIFFNRDRIQHNEGINDVSNEDVYFNIVTKSGELMNSKFSSDRVQLNDKKYANIKIKDPLTNEEFSISSLEKVFPT